MFTSVKIRSSEFSWELYAQYRKCVTIQNAGLAYLRNAILNYWNLMSWKPAATSSHSNSISCCGSWEAWQTATQLKMMMLFDTALPITWWPPPRDGEQLHHNLLTPPQHASEREKFGWIFGKQHVPYINTQNKTVNTDSKRGLLMFYFPAKLKGFRSWVG